jgi:hypothetical protein
VAGVLAITAPAHAADRPTDKDVKALIERVNHDRDRFEDQLDGKLKRSILRGPNGEINVARYLDDLQENVGKMKDRFSDTYAASAEVTTVLRQATDISRFMATQPADLDGASEWNRLRASLSELAAAYHVSLPLADGQQARRLNDLEVKKSAELIAKNADQYRKELDSSLKKDKSVDKPTREAALAEVNDLKDAARTLASLVGDGRPASGEARALLDRAARVRGTASGRTLAPSASEALRETQRNIEKVTQAFGLGSPTS